MVSAWFLCLMYALISCACALLVPEQAWEILLFIARVFGQIWRKFRSEAIEFWHVSRNWQWFSILFLGALGLVGIQEYGFGILLLTSSAIGLLSKLLHWESYEWFSGPAKVVGSIAIGILFAMFVVVSLFEQQDRPLTRIPEASLWLVEKRWPMQEIKITFRHEYPPSYAIRKTPATVLRDLEQQVRHKPSPPLHFASVETAIASGENKAKTVIMEHDLNRSGKLPPQLSCHHPFNCYSEKDLLTKDVALEVDENGWGRIFLLVANTDTVTIPAPYVAAYLETPETGVFLARQDVRSGDSVRQVEYASKENADVLPFAVADTFSDYVVDIHVEDKAVTKILMNCRIMAANLKIHYVRFVVALIPHS